jgi:hypothetical protein
MTGSSLEKTTGANRVQFTKTIMSEHTCMDVVWPFAKYLAELQFVAQLCGSTSTSRKFKLL